MCKVNTDFGFTISRGISKTIKKEYAPFPNYRSQITDCRYLMNHKVILCNESCNNQERNKYYYYYLFSYNALWEIIELQLSI